MLSILGFGRWCEASTSVWARVVTVYPAGALGDGGRRHHQEKYLGGRCSPYERLFRSMLRLCYAASSRTADVHLFPVQLKASSRCLVLGHQLCMSFPFCQYLHDVRGSRPLCSLRYLLLHVVVCMGSGCRALRDPKNVRDAAWLGVWLASFSLFQLALSPRIIPASLICADDVQKT